jgi:acetylornithine/N-succinyldiaminopimelate aminotransferase
MKREEVIQVENRHYFPVFQRLPLVLSHGEGSWVWDMNGEKYLDFLSGIAVNALGHADKRIAGAIAAQAAKLVHCSSLFYTEEQSNLVKKLTQISGFPRVFLCNSGAEANEGAIKLARKYAYRNYDNKFKIISAANSFHGRTLATLTATGTPKYHEGYAPLPTGFIYVPFGDAAALEAAMVPEVAAVILEPVQGEGGINVPPPGYLQAVRELCDKHEAMLIFDEIQTGMGRTGAWFAFEHEDVRPDIMTVAKALGGGYPISAILATEQAAKGFSYGDHGTTFGGSPLASAVALAVIEAIESGHLIDNAKKCGAYFKKKLALLAEKYPDVIKDVRGEGLLLGLELKGHSRWLVDACLAKKVILNSTAGNVVRILPPLNVKKSEIDVALAAMDEAFAEQGAAE